MNAASHDAAGFFLLRAPALPFETLVGWQDGGNGAARQAPCATDLRARLHELLRRPDVREALFVASPAVEGRLSPWIDGAVPRAEADKLEGAYVRYLQRMCWRTTPFGMFAGTAVGTIGSTTRLALAGPERRRRLTRIDSALLHGVHRSLIRDPAVRAALVYRRTSHLYVRDSEVVFVGPRAAGAGHRTRTVPRSAALDLVLDLAARGATPGAFAEALCAAGIAPDVPAAARLIEPLIDAGLLTDPLEPPVVGEDPLAHLIDGLHDVPAARAIRGALIAIRDELDALDAADGPRPPEHYRHTVAMLDALPVVARPPQPFHTVMRHAATELVLDRQVTRDVLAGASALCALAPAVADPLHGFLQAFDARYAEREVALVEALDDVAGIGFDPQSSTTAERPALLRALVRPVDASDTVAWGPRERWLLERVARTPAGGELVVSDGDLRALPPAAGALPDAFSASVSLHADGGPALHEGRYRVHVRRVLGPTAVSLLGRFCAGDPALTEHARRLAAREAALAPDAIVAEIVHLPHPSSGNVMRRPALRRFEIVALGGSGSADATRLALDDLLVSVSDNTVRLRSRTLGRRVLPRLSCSDNALLSGLPAYRFLMSVARAEGATSLSWDWGPLAQLTALPRVVHGRCLLALARWRLDAEVLAAIGARAAGRDTARDELRRSRRIPRWTMLCQRDLNMPIDWDNRLSIDAFLAICDPRGAVIEEMFPGPGGPFAHAPDGRYAAELVIPFVRRHARPRSAGPSARAPGHALRAHRPGGEWLYAKLYCNERAADRVLRDVVYPLVTEHVGAFDRWFFVRYGDPDWHLRVRFHGQPAVLRGELMPALDHLLHRIDGERWVHRVVFDTYDPEWERYGGADAMSAVEALFHHDSDAALGVALAYPADADARWQLALRGMYGVIVQLVPDAAERVRITREARLRYAAQFGLTGRAGQVLGQRFRDQHARIVDALSELSSAHPLRLGGELLDERDRRWSALVPALRSRLASSLDPAERHAVEARIVVSLAHMHANRLLATDHRLQETVLCSFLERVLATQHARAGQADACRIPG